MTKGDYDNLLKRARAQLPKDVFERPRFDVPGVSREREGSKTLITNFSQICDYLNRDPKHVLKFLLRELATSGYMEGQRAVFIGRFTGDQLNEKIDKYVNEFVLCPVCKKPDTKIMKEARVALIKCMACGAREPIRTIK